MYITRFNIDFDTQASFHTNVIVMTKSMNYSIGKHG